MKKIAIINDISGLGRCSMAVQIPIISVMEIMACPIPTGVFSAQTAFENFSYTDLTTQINDSISHFQDLNIDLDGILIGFMTSAKQLDMINSNIYKIKNKNTILLTDPILGDDGKQFEFFDNDYLNKIKNLVSQSTIITPNITELCLLTDTRYEDLIKYQNLSIKDYALKIKNVAQKLFTDNLNTIAITGVVQKIKDEIFISNLIFTKSDTYYSTNKFQIGNFSGTGDIFAALMIAHMVHNIDIKKAIENTSNILDKIISKSINTKSDRRLGTNFELVLKDIQI